jgi:hypothetical protein
MTSLKRIAQDTLEWLAQPDQYPTVPASVIRKDLGLSWATVSTLLVDLERLGLVEYVPPGPPSAAEEEHELTARAMGITPGEGGWRPTEHARTYLAALSSTVVREPAKR